MLVLVFKYGHNEVLRSHAWSNHVSACLCKSSVHKKKEKNQRVRTHDVRLEVIVEMHRVHGLLDHGVDLVVADMNLAHCE